MRNTDQLRDNIAAARAFKEPLKTAEIESLRQAFLASQPTLCADCDGRCALAAGTKAPLGDIARYLTYYERHGARAEARQHFAALPGEARDWAGRPTSRPPRAAHARASLDFAAPPDPRRAAPRLSRPPTRRRVLPSPARGLYPWPGVSFS